MKKKMLTVLITALMLTSCTNTTKANSKTETETVEVKQYPSVTVVIDVNYEDNVVAIQDAVGYIYVFTGTEDWEVGDACAVIFSNNGTEKIYDDEIVSVRYSSFELKGKEWLLCH